jgi:tetratricopeptide (TPR) repeat protein
VKNGLSAEAIAELKEFAKGSNKPVGNDPKNPAAGNNPDVNQKEKEKGIDIEALITDILKLMEASCLENANQLDKPFCRRLTAEAAAVCGKMDAASKHLDKLVELGQNLSYYRILPWIEIYWAMSTAGEKDKSAKVLEKALSEAPKIPVFGQVRFEIVGRLAAALAAAGRVDDASAQLTKVQSVVPDVKQCISQPSLFLRRPPLSFAESDAEMAARLQIATDGHVASLSDTNSVLPWKFPQSVAVTASLMNRDLSKVALEWATGQADLDAKAECLAYWAEEVARRKGTEGSVDADGAIAEATKDLPPVLAAHVWARAGCGRLRKNDYAGVAEALKLAVAQLEQVGPPPAALKIPTDVKSINRFKPPQSVQFSLQAATAAAEITFLQAQSKETIDAAEKSLDLTLEFVDATASSLTAIQKIYDETNCYDEATDTFDLAKLREYVKKEAKGKLKKEDDIKREAGIYKQKIIEIRIAAHQRFELQRLLLSQLRGAGLGLNSKVWIIVNSRARAEDISKRDDFFLNPLPGELIEGLKGNDEANAVLGAWKLKFNEPAPPRPVSVEFNERLMKDDSVGAVKFLEASGPKSSQRDEIFLQAACRLADAKKLKTAFDFIPRISDRSVREDCYRLVAAIATKRNLVNDVWAEVKDVTQQTDKIAICRGIIAGLRTPEN